MMTLDPVFLARVQFAFTVTFHIIFPAITIGLASWLAVLEGLWLKTRHPLYKEIYLMWVKIFAVCFGIGVVSGLVLSYQFGTNWSVFSHKIGNIIGPLLGYEVLTAFFLEASFLGIMLFGWERVSERMHFVSTCIVALGTLLSAFWILSANSWMQTPQGFTISGSGLFFPTDWFKIIFNPSFPYRLVHMVIAAYLSTAFLVCAVACYYLWQAIYLPHARVMLAMAMLMAVFVAPMQLVSGDLHGLNTLKYQPAKIAAMEGLWDTTEGADLHLFAIPNQAEQTNHYEITIPNLTSLILTHRWDGKVKGLKAWPKHEQPPVAIVFWSFRIMVGLGCLMILTGLFAIFLYWRKTLFTTRWFQYWGMLMAPSGLIALLAGWFVTEVGRQPYTIYGLLRTSESLSPVLPASIALSLFLFICTYTVLFSVTCYYIGKLIQNGPKPINPRHTFYAHGLTAAVTQTFPKPSQ